MLKDAFEIKSQNGNKYIYNYKYNVLLPISLYNEQKIDQLAKKHYQKPEQIDKERFMNNNRYEKYRCLNLVLTDACNFRCSYCANSSVYLYSKGYSNNSMSYEIIDKALNLYIKNYIKNLKTDPNLRFIIMFYGGEPLLEFEKIKYVVNYISTVSEIKEPIYTVTTNGYLINDEMLDIFSTNNFTINVSMDGYQEIHDKNRKTIGGDKTFEKVCENFRKLYKLIGKDRMGVITTFDTQVSPLKLYNFYKENPDIDSCLTRVSSVGMTNTLYYNTITKYPSYDQELNMLYKFYKNGENLKFLKQLFDNKFMKMITRKEFYDRTYSICSPLSAKFTVAANGTIHICEKVNENYPIGNVFTGINKEIAYKYYEDIVNIRKNKCATCEFRNLCEPCFATLNRSGGNFELIEDECLEIKLGAINMLELYCTFLDEGEWPEEFEHSINQQLKEELVKGV